MATLVACPCPNSQSTVALGLEEPGGEVEIVYPEDVEGFKVTPPWVIPLLENVTLENVQEKMPEATLRAAFWISMM